MRRTFTPSQRASAPESHGSHDRPPGFAPASAPVGSDTSLSGLAPEFEQRIRAQIHRSITIAHVATFVTGAIGIAGSPQLRRRRRAWLALGASGVQGLMARRAMVRGDFVSTRLAAANALGAALNQELMPTIPGGVSKGERGWVRDQAVWLSAMGGAGGSRRPGLWALVAHGPLLVRAATGEMPAASHVGGQALWLAFLRTALTDALLRAPAVLSSVDARTEAARITAEAQATRSALTEAVNPLLDHMCDLRDHSSELPPEARRRRCRQMLDEADAVCDRAASTLRDEPHDHDLYESLLSDLQRRSDRTNIVSYRAVIAGSITNLVFDFLRDDVSRVRIAASAAVTTGLAWHSMRNPSRFLQGEIDPGSTGTLVIHGMAGGLSALVLHGAPADCSSFGNRDLLGLISSGTGSENTSVLVPWALSAVVGIPSLYRAQLKNERVFLLARSVGMGFGLPLALNNFLRGIRMTNEVTAESREQLVADARAQGTGRAMRWAQLAAHDYVKQTARYLLDHPQPSPDHFVEVLSDAITQLEVGLESSFEHHPERAEIGALVDEVVRAYRRLSLDPQIVLDLRGPISAGVERAVLTAVNQGLANVLAHTSDRVPTVRVATAVDGAVVTVTNRATSTAPIATSPAGTGFRLLDASLAPVGGIRTLRTNDRETVLIVRIPSRVPANGTSPN